MSATSDTADTCAFHGPTSNQGSVRTTTDAGPSRSADNVDLEGTVGAHGHGWRSLGSQLYPKEMIYAMRPNELDIGPLPEDAHARLIHLSNVLGRVLFDSVRNPARERAQAMPEGVRREAETLVDYVLYGVVQVLDGVTRPIGNDRLDMQLVISSRSADEGPRRRDSTWAAIGSDRPNERPTERSVDHSVENRPCQSRPRIQSCYAAE